MGDVVKPAVWQWDEDFKEVVAKVDAVNPGDVVAVVIFDAKPIGSTALGIAGHEYDFGYMPALEVRTPGLSYDEPSEFVSTYRNLNKHATWDTAIRLAVRFNVPVFDASHDALPIGLSS